MEEHIFGHMQIVASNHIKPAATATATATATSTATDPSPANSPNKYSRLVCQDIYFCLKEPAYLRPPPHFFGTYKKILVFHL